MPRNRKLHMGSSSRKKLKIHLICLFVLYKESPPNRVSDNPSSSSIMSRQHHMQSYLAQVNKSILARNGHNLAWTLSIMAKGFNELPDYTNDASVERDFGELLHNAAFLDVLVAHYRVAVACRTGNVIEACDLQSNFAQRVLRYIIGWDIWTLPVLYTACHDIYILASAADKLLLSRSERADKLEEAARTINRAFTICITDRAPIESSRKWGTYKIIGFLFKTYFKLNKLALSKNVVRAVRASIDMPLLTSFPRGQIVTFRYYVGIMHFLAENYEEARQELQSAFTLCHYASRKNQEKVFSKPTTNARLILTYLIPSVILASNRLLQHQCLKTYPRLLNLYGPLIAALQRGDLMQYDRALQKREVEMVGRKLFLAFERARLLVVRSLFRRTFLLMLKSTRIQISTFQRALQFTGSEVEIEEVECMVANTIYNGYMKGYISREKATVVLSKDNPFPSLPIT